MIKLALLKLLAGGGGAIAVSALSPAVVPTALERALPTRHSATFGDAPEYSAGALADLYCRERTGGACNYATGAPYNVAGGAGATIDSVIVVAMGASGNLVNRNFQDIDDAYQAPSGMAGSPDPGQVRSGEDLNGAWDTSAAALRAQLAAAQTPLSFFNNDRVNGAAHLGDWGRIGLTSTAPLDSLELYVASQRTAGMSERYLDPIVQRSGGIDLNKGRGAIPASGVTESGIAPNPGSNNSPLDPKNPRVADYAFSGSNYCVDQNTFFPAACDSPNASMPTPNNRRVNEVARAAALPELDTWLENLAIADRNKYAIHVDPRVECHAKNAMTAIGTEDAETDTTPCTTLGADMRSLNNGYEQLLVAGYAEPAFVPEPGTLGLLGIALGGLGLLRRRVSRA